MDQDLENWMSNLPPKIKSLPLIYIAIPGSHDSMTYAITKNSKLSPDAEPIIQVFQFLGPILTTIMAKWAKTQTIDVTQQLNWGVRYFDLRIATKKEDPNLYFVHGLYADNVSTVLEQINEFLVTHTKEVVILDCQHFYAFEQKDHEQLMNLLNCTFGSKLVPYSPHMTHITLKYMMDHGYQIIVIYRSDAARFGQPLLWPSASFPTPWADTDSVPTLIDFLNDRLKCRNNSCGFVSQCVLTPSSFFVFSHLFSSLKNKCFVPLEKAKYKWLEKQKPGRGGVNIIISDFVDYQNNNFSKVVINLNQKLLDSHSKFVTSSSSSMTPIDNSI